MILNDLTLTTLNDKTEQVLESQRIEAMEEIQRKNAIAIEEYIKLFEAPSNPIIIESSEIVVPRFAKFLESSWDSATSFTAAQFTSGIKTIKSTVSNIEEMPNSVKSIGGILKTSLTEFVKVEYNIFHYQFIEKNCKGRVDYDESKDEQKISENLDLNMSESKLVNLNSEIQSMTLISCNDSSDEIQKNSNIECADSKQNN